MTIVNYQVAYLTLLLSRTFILIAAFMVSFTAFSQQAIPLSAGNHISEVSGIALSIQHPNVLYIHNDSGDTSRFFSINKQGQLISTFYFKGNPRLTRRGVLDCEAIATGAGPDKKKSYVYLGDIGDNFAFRGSITIYRFEEPSSNKAIQQLSAITLHAKYPDRPRDAETLMVDNIDRLIYIVTKREDSVRVYTMPIDNNKDTTVLTYRCSLHFKGMLTDKWIVDGNVSNDGKHVVLKSYAKVYYWTRREGEPIWQTLQSKPTELPYKREPQGEAICFNETIDGYYTISEGINPPLYEYKMK